MFDCKHVLDGVDTKRQNKSFEAHSERTKACYSKHFYRTTTTTSNNNNNNNNNKKKKKKKKGISQVRLHYHLTFTPVPFSVEKISVQ